MSKPIPNQKQITPESHSTVVRCSVLNLRTSKLSSAVLSLLAVVFLLVGAFFVTRATTPAHAAINDQLNFQGRLRNSSQAITPDGDYHLRFKIYSGGDGNLGGGDETLDWTETYTTGDLVRVENGYFSVQLGSLTSLSSVDFNNSTLWLSVDVGGDTGTASWDGEMDPFIRLTSTPYAFNSDQLDGLDSEDFVQLGQGSTQAINNANTAISINQQGAGNLLQLQSSGSDVFTVSNSGNTDINGTLQVANAVTLSNYTSCSALATGVSGVVSCDTNTYATSLQGAYVGGNTITATDAEGDFSVTLQEATNAIFNIDSGATGRFAVQAAGTDVLGVTSTAVTIDQALTVNSTSTFNESLTVAATKTINLTGGTTAQRPGSPTEGMIFFDTDTDTLLTYSNGKWQADRGEYIIVAANDSTQTEKDSADYTADATADQSEINSALTAAAGGEVILLPGTYSVDGSISIPNETTLRGSGEGTVIEAAAGLSTYTIVNTTTGGSGADVTVKDLTIDGNDSVATGSLSNIYFSGLGSGSGSSTVNGGAIENVKVINANANAVYLLTVNNFTVNKLEVVNATDDGLWVDGATYLRISDSKIVDASYGIDLDNATDSTIVGNIFDSNSQGLWIHGTSSDVTVSGNTMTNHNSNGIRVSASEKNINVTSNVITNNLGDGIYWIAADYSLISGNVISNNTGNGVHLGGGANYVTVTGNSLVNNGNGTDAVIYIEGPTNDSTITNNRIETTSSNTAAAIEIIAGANTPDDTYIAGNNITGTFSGGYVADGGTDTIIAGQVDSSGNYDLQPAGNISLLADTDITGILNVTQDNTSFTVNPATNRASLTSSVNNTIFHIGGPNTGTAALQLSEEFDANYYLYVDGTANEFRIGGNDNGSLDYLALNQLGDLNLTGDLTATGGNITGDTNTNLTVESNGTGNLVLTAGGNLVFSGFDCTGLSNGGSLTADASGNISCSADDGGAFSSSGGLTTLNTSTDSVTIGSSTNLAKLGVDGDADEIQLLIQGNATQNADLLVVEESDGTDVLSVSSSNKLSLNGITEISNGEVNGTINPTVTLEQTATACCDSPSETATFTTQPSQDNLLVAFAGHRSSPDTPSISGSGWTQVYDESFQDTVSDRREIVMYYKIAGPSEPTGVTITWGNGVTSAHGVVIREYSTDEGEFVFDTTAINNSGVTEVNSLSTGTTATSGSDDSLVISGLVRRDETGAATWTNGLTGVAEASGGGSAISVQTAWDQDSTASTKESTASWTTNAHGNAGIAVFSINPVAMPTSLIVNRTDTSSTTIAIDVQDQGTSVFRVLHDGTLRVSSLESCSTVETDANGTLSCGTSSTGSDEIITVAANNSTAAEKAAADYVADGVGDDVEIQAALDALEANSAAGGQVVLLAGTYTTGAVINVPNNTVLSGVGDATVITVGASASTFDIINNKDRTGTGTNVVVRDLRIDGNEAAGATVGNGIEYEVLGSGSGSTGDVVFGGLIENVTIENNQADAIDIVDSNHVTVNNVRMNDIATGGGIDLDSTTTQFYITLSNNRIYNMGGFGINTNNSENLQIIDNVIENTNARGILLLDGDDSVIARNEITNTGTEGIRLTLTSDTRLTDNMIKDTGTNDIGDAGIFIGSSDRIMIIGNNIYNSGGLTAVPSIDLSGDSDQNTVTDNTFREPDEATDATYAIEVGSSTGNDNYIADNNITEATYSGGYVLDNGTGTVIAGQITSGGELEFNGADVFIDDRLGFGVDTQSIADNGGGTPATLTLDPVSSYVDITCNDGDGCTVTMDESSADDGDIVYIVNSSANTVTINDSSGVSELAGNFSGGQYDSLSLIYGIDRWIETSRSDN